MTTAHKPPETLAPWAEIVPGFTYPVADLFV